MLSDFAALAFGVLVAIASVAFYQWLAALSDEKAAVAEGGSLLISAVSQARMAAAFAAFTAIPIVFACIPVWLAFERVQWNNCFAAAGLGFAASVAAWVIAYDFSSPLLEAITTGLPYGFCGALAGAAAWWRSPERRAELANKR